MNARATRIGLAGLTLLALIVRLAGSNGGLWYDEVVLLVETAREPFWQIATTFRNLNSHPLYSLLAHASLTTFGEHPWSLRLPAILFGTANVPLLYALGREVARPLEAWLSAAVLAFSYHHIWFSQNARGYTALAFWTTMASLCLLRAVKEGSPRWFAAYGVAAALGVYTHLTMGFVIAAHALSCASIVAWPKARTTSDASTLESPWEKLREGATGRGLVAAFGLAVVLTIALYAPLLPQLYEVFTRPPRSGVRVATHAWALREVLRGLQIGLGAGGVAVAVGLAAVGGWTYFRRQPRTFFLFALPGLLTVAGTFLMGTTTRPRFFVLLAGYIALMLVRGAMRTGHWSTGRIGMGGNPRLADSIGGTLIALLIAANVAAFGYLYRYPKQDFGGALTWVERSQQPGDVVVTAGLAIFPYASFYGRPWQPVTTADELTAVRSRSARVRVLYTFLEYGDADLAAVLQRDCRDARTFQGTVGGGDVVVCTLAAAAP